MQREIASQGERIGDGEYTCPMHPEVRQVGTGKVPEVRDVPRTCRARWPPACFPPNCEGTAERSRSTSRPRRVITVLVLLGQVLELRAREKTSGAIKALPDLAPKTAIRVQADGSDETVQIDTIRPGEMLRVRPGEKVPVDGELVEGRGTVDESMVTGEPMPVVKAPGSKLTAGTINQTGGFVMRAEKVGADTLLSQIVHMVDAAQRSRTPIQRMADQVAAWFVPLVLLVAAITFSAWLI